jgi:hypothetical protein
VIKHNNFISIVLFLSAAIFVVMMEVQYPNDYLFNPYPMAKDVAIHPQPWLYMGLLRIKGLLLIAVIGLVWNPDKMRYWFMLLVFLLLEVADVIDYFLRYGKDFSPEYFGIDMNTIKVPFYLILLGYNIWRNKKDAFKYAQG